MPGGRPRSVVGVDDGLHTDTAPRRHGLRGQSHRLSHRLPRRKDVAALEPAIGLRAKDKVLVVRVSTSLFRGKTSPVWKKTETQIEQSLWRGGVAEEGMRDTK